MHACRVCHLAKEFGDHLHQQLSEDTQSMIVKADPDWKKLWIFEEEERLCVQLAGLCHDLGLITACSIIIYTDNCSYS